MKWFERLLICTVFGGCSLLAPCQIARGEPIPPEGVELFNGTDFTGWTFYMQSNSTPDLTWSVTNGVIHCTGRPFGYARTEKSYSNYRLTVEWRFVKVAPHADNSGVFVHIQPPDQIWPKCIECQGQYQHQGDFWLQLGVTASNVPGDGSKPMHVAMAAKPNEKPAGQWNDYEIVARGDSLEVLVNGRSMNKLTGCNVSSGCIGIQSEGGDIEVRKVFLQPLK